RRWAEDQTGEIMRRAKATVRAMYAAAARAPDDATAKALARWAVGSQSEARLKAMIDLARDAVPILPDALDADPWLLNLANGTLDLHIGQLRPHDRADLITKLAPVTYDAGAEAPTWLAFLDRILAGDRELIDFLQRAIGYSLTGDT